MFVYRKIWHASFSCNAHFEIRPFPLLPTKFLKMSPFNLCTKRQVILNFGTDLLGKSEELDFLLNIQNESITIMIY